MIEIYIKSSEAILDDIDTPTEVLGWNIVYTGQRLTDMVEYSVTGTLTLPTPIPYENPVSFSMLMDLIGSYADEQGWDQQILEALDDT